MVRHGPEEPAKGTGQLPNLAGEERVARQRQEFFVADETMPVIYHGTQRAESHMAHRSLPDILDQLDGSLGVGAGWCWMGGRGTGVRRRGW